MAAAILSRHLYAMMKLMTSVWIRMARSTLSTRTATIRTSRDINSRGTVQARTVRSTLTALRTITTPIIITITI